MSQWFQNETTIDEFIGSFSAAISTVHLLIWSGAFALTFLIFRLASQITLRRLKARYRALPGARIPISPEDLPLVGRRCALVLWLCLTTAPCCMYGRACIATSHDRRPVPSPRPPACFPIHAGRLRTRVGVGVRTALRQQWRACPPPPLTHVVSTRQSQTASCCTLSRRL